MGRSPPHPSVKAGHGGKGERRLSPVLTTPATTMRKIERPRSALERHDVIVDRIVAALLPAMSPIAPGSAQARDRRDVQREVARQIGRALFRAERKARRLPPHVRQSASYVMRRRRKIAYEVSRAVRSLGAGDELSNAIAERAAMRYPRDGVILPDATERDDRPRTRGEAPRDQGTNPRALGKSPRQLGESPKQRRRRAAADLTDVEVIPSTVTTRSTSNASTKRAAATTAAAPVAQTQLTLPDAFTQEIERQTRELTAEMLRGKNVTSGMTAEQRIRFYGRVDELRRRDRETAE